MDCHLRNADESFRRDGEIEKASGLSVVGYDEDVARVDVSLMAALRKESQGVAPFALQVQHEGDIRGSCGAYGPCGSGARCWEFCER